jgi:NADPH:quinone reductase-like Zn-dependent oxidoreductase
VDRSRRIALATQGNFGTWAEYTIVNDKEVFPLRKSISDEQGAMMLVNPLTAWALMDRAVRDRHRGVLLNAANSALGRMIVRIAAARGSTSVAIVTGQSGRCAQGAWRKRRGRQQWPMILPTNSPTPVAPITRESVLMPSPVP